MQFRKSALVGVLFAAAGLLIPAAAGAQSSTVPDFTQFGYPTVVASQSLAAGAAGSVQYGPISVQIPAGAFASPVTFDLLEGPVANFQSKVPSGQTVISDFAFKVVDTATGQLVGKFQQPVLFTLQSQAVTSQSVYDDVTATGAITANPIPATISGTTLTHPIAAALVGWVVTSPTSSVQAVPDFTGLGYPTVVASQNVSAGAAAQVQYGPISVQIPAGTFSTAVDFQLLEGPISGLQAKAPTGQTVISDFAFRVVDSATGQRIGVFQKPVLFTLQSSSVTGQSVYDDVTAAGAFMPNPIPAKISGTTLTHPIAAALVGWAVTSPSSAVQAVPDMTQHGFPNVVASENIAAGAAGSIQHGPISVQIPAGTFDTAVTFELLHASRASFQAPAGQSVISAFAFKVFDTATGQLVGQFQKPVLFHLTSNAVTSQSVYDDVTPAGAIMPNPIPAKISGHTLTHPIAASVVGWVVTSPAKTVPAATSPNTGVPVLPLVGAGALLVGGGLLLLRRGRSSQA